MDYIDLEMSRSDGLSVDEKKIAYEDYLTEIDAHKIEYEKVIQLGKRLLDELEEANVRQDDAEAKLKDVEKRWTSTHDKLKEIKEKIDFLMKVKECKQELTSLHMMLDGHSKWFEVNHQNSQIELFRVSVIMVLIIFLVYVKDIYKILIIFRIFQVKVKSMKSCEDRVVKLTDAVSKLANEEMIAEEATSLKSDTDAFVNDWRNLLKR